MKLKLLWIFLISAFCFLVPKLSIAQEEDPGPLPPATEDVPIDGGVSLLLAAGVAYGVKKVHESRKKGSAPQSEENPEK